MNDLVHLAIIMDGNGRWAQRQEKNRSYGHEEGAKKVREITEYCAKIGIEYLTLYAFSTENWKRPKSEVAFLMKLLAKFLKKEAKEVDEKSFSSLLDTHNIPDVDLLIRTGGDKRLSNFLLWQSAYAELFFTKTLWPDFSSGELETIISEYKNTSRRFGAL